MLQVHCTILSAYGRSRLLLLVFSMEQMSIHCYGRFQLGDDTTFGLDEGFVGAFFFFCSTLVNGKATVGGDNV